MRTAHESPLAFRRPGVASLLFVAAGGQIVLSVLRSRAQDPTFPPGNVSGAIVATTLPALALGALLVATWWAEHRNDSLSDTASAVKSRPLTAPR